MATDHRQKALDLLELAQGYAVNSPARPVVLAEAQVHATLALSTKDAQYVALDAVADLGSDNPAEKPTAKRRTRKSTPAKPADAEAAK